MIKTYKHLQINEFPLRSLFLLHTASSGSLLFISPNSSPRKAVSHAQMIVVNT